MLSGPPSAVVLTSQEQTQVKLPLLVTLHFASCVKSLSMQEYIQYTNTTDICYLPNLLEVSAEGMCLVTPQRKTQEEFMFQI